MFFSPVSVVVLRLSSVVVCNTAGGRAGWPAAGRAGGRAADTPRRASSVTSRYGETLYNMYKENFVALGATVAVDFQNGGRRQCVFNRSFPVLVSASKTTQSCT